MTTNKHRAAAAKIYKAIAESANLPQEGSIVNGIRQVCADIIAEETVPTGHLAAVIQEANGVLRKNEIPLSAKRSIRELITWATSNADNCCFLDDELSKREQLISKLIVALKVSASYIPSMGNGCPACRELCSPGKCKVCNAINSAREVLKIAEGRMDTGDSSAKQIKALKIRIDMMEAQILNLKNEVNCRHEHGAEGSEHLKYVEERLNKILQTYV